MKRNMCIDYPEDMGFELEIGVPIRKSVRTCYRLLLHHPLLVAVLLFLTFLHRFFPFAFSLLVAASPVLVCSVTLLGTLLIFGQPTLPETEREKKITHDFASISETAISERNGRLFRDKFSGKNVDELSCSRYSSDPEGSIGYVPLIDETFHYTDSEKRESDSKELENQRAMHKKKLGINAITWDVKALEKPASIKRDHSGSSQGGDGGDDEASDSGSDRAESSSPDASIADILPILDELHPLLDLDAPLPVHMSPDDSGIESDRSNDGSNESDDEDTEIPSIGVKEYGVDDNDGDEKEAHDGKEDESKSAIKWTEDDQKNLRDLGNLELERNRCLENLMTRRRASQRDEKNLIELDTSENPFNIPQISTTRHNPFDLSHDSYDDMGLPPIPGSAPSSYLPRRNPFDLLYESNEENPELKGDHVEQECATFLPTNTIFRRHESFRPSRSGDAKQERQDLKWRPVFVPEQLASEGTSYSSFQGLPREASDSKLSSILDTESVSSGEDLDERKLSERVKEAEVISNIYQASHLVNHRSHSSEDLDPLELERPGEKDIQHDESEIKLVEVENGSASLPGTGGLVIPVEPVTSPTHLGPEAFEDTNSNRSSSSLSSEVDEESSDLRKEKSMIFEPFDTEMQTMSGMVDDTQIKPPVYDTSPPGSAKVRSSNSISSDFQAEISEVVTVPSSAEMRVPSVEQALYSDLHGESIEKATSGNEQIGATSHVHASVESERVSGECNRFFLTSSHSDAHDDLSPNQFSEANVGEQTQPSNAKDRLSKVETGAEGFTKENASSNIKTGVEESAATPDSLKKVSEDIDPQIPASSNSKDGSTEVGTKTSSPNKASKANDRELPKPSSSKDRSTEFRTNANSSTKEIETINTGTAVQEAITTHSTAKEDVEDNVGELRKLSNPEHGCTDVNNKVDSTKDIALSSIGLGLQETAKTPVKQVSESDVSKLPKSSEDISLSNTGSGLQETGTPVKQVSKGDDSELSNPSKDELAKGATDNAVGSTTSLQETVPTLPKQVSQGSLSESPESSKSKDGSNKLESNAVGSAKEMASNTIGTGVQETVTTRTSTREMSEANVGELPKPSDSKDGHKEIKTNAVSSTTETASEVTSSSVQKKFTTDQREVSEGNLIDLPKTSNSKDVSLDTATSNAAGSTKIVTGPLKQISEGNYSEAPKPSDLRGGSTEAGCNAAASTQSVQENTTTLKQVSQGNDSELPKSSNSKDGLPEVTNAADSTKSVQDTATKEVSETNVSELPTPSNLKHASTEVRTDAALSTRKLESRKMGTEVQEGITTHTAKQVSDGNIGELPIPSLANDGSAPEVGTNAEGSTKSLQETVTTRKQLSEGNVNELPNPSDLEDGSITEVPNAVNSAKSVPETIAKQQVLEGNVGELPIPSKDGSTEVGTNVVDSTKKLAPSNVRTSVEESISPRTEIKVAEDSVKELPKPSSLMDEVHKVGVDVVGSTKDVPSINAEFGVQTSIATSEADVAELPRPNTEGQVDEVLKPSISEESDAGELPQPTNPKESNAGESKKQADPEESNAGESQKPAESKGWLWW